MKTKSWWAETVIKSLSEKKAVLKIFLKFLEVYRKKSVLDLFFDKVADPECRLNKKVTLVYFGSFPRTV